MSFPSITNRGEFFSNHYLDAIIGSDLGDIRSRWDDAEAHDKSTPRSRLRAAAGHPVTTPWQPTSGVAEATSAIASTACTA